MTPFNGKLYKVSESESRLSCHASCHSCQSVSSNLFKVSETETRLSCHASCHSCRSGIFLGSCRTYGLSPGLNCSNVDVDWGCYQNFAWCRGDYSISCEGSEGKFATNNQGFCSNTTFWQNKTCDLFYFDGDKAALGERCSGGAQQCIYPWYLSGNYVYEVA